MGEIETFDKLNKSPKHPLTLILGGTKTYDKVKAARHLINKADHILIGGAVANNFLQGAGIEIGKSFLDEAYVDKAKGKKISPVDQAKELLKTHKDKLVMPFDMVAADSLKNPKEVKTIELDKGELIPGDWMFLDIGPRTTDKFVKIIKNSKTIFWDGPMGVYEDTRFRRGTRKVAETVAENDKTTILAGGDTAAVAEDFGLIFRYSHVSIAGGAALQYLAGRPMPGLDVLKSK
jgi:phosphoglycerate kinase